MRFHAFQKRRVADHNGIFERCAALWGDFHIAAQALVKGELTQRGAKLLHLRLHAVVLAILDAMHELAKRRTRVQYRVSVPWL
ncbi:MAG: hypothetical protein QE509_11685 [Gammaproteobacteria bacterium]|jgi:hypothetical protein|nr:hypothetical protein [Gammaproteobacteria bacterium]